MRLLKLGVYHPLYLQNFYVKRDNLETQPYAVQHRSLIDDCFGSSNFWTQALTELNYETSDLIANAEPLQKRWAHENNYSFNDQQWLFEITAAQIKQFRPDILLVADYSTFTADFLRNIRRECASIRLILGWCGAPHSDNSVFGEWDIALSCIPTLVAEFKRGGLRSFHVNHAFAPRILEQLDLAAPPSADFTFSGSILKQRQFHIERETLVRDLIKQANLQVYSDIKLPPVKEQRRLYYLQKIQKVLTAAAAAGIPGSWINAVPRAKRIKNSSALAAQLIDVRLARQAKPPVFGLAMFQQLRDSRVVLNNHIDISKKSASNMRLFEATGVGTCLITDWKENLTDFFEPDSEVLTYRSAEECAEKVRFILEHETERQSIAGAGQRRTLREHTFQNRAIQIDEIIKKSLALP